MSDYRHLLPAAGARPRGNRGPSPHVVALQHRLGAHGFYRGARHGLLDFRTRGAVGNFQRFYGMAPTPGGVPDAPTLAALNQAPDPEALNAIANTPMADNIPADIDENENENEQPQQGGFAMSESSMHRSPGSWDPTGLRVPLVLAQSIPAATSALVSQNPQMDFRGENFVVDTIIVGPNCTVTVPTVGTTPQVAGGPASTGVPGTIFSPNQNVPLDFSMMISNQGNAVSVTVTNTLTSLALAFAALLFGHEVSHQAAQQQRMQQWEAAKPHGGMAPAGAFGGMQPAGSFGGAAYGGRGGHGGGRYMGR